MTWLLPKIPWRNIKIASPPPRIDRNPEPPRTFLCVVFTSASGLMLLVGCGGAPNSEYNTISVTVNYACRRKVFKWSILLCQQSWGLVCLPQKSHDWPQSGSANWKMLSLQPAPGCCFCFYLSIWITLFLLLCFLSLYRHFFFFKASWMIGALRMLSLIFVDCSFRKLKHLSKY